MAPVPGILYVTMQPQSTLSDAQFTDWYNNEHGPHRLRLSFIPNGFRYHAKDLPGEKGSKEKPEWMAIYDVTDMAEMTKPSYLALQEDGMKTKREKDTMKQIIVDRRFYDLINSLQAKEFKKLEDIGASEENIMISMTISIEPGTEAIKNKWLEDEYLPTLPKIPGWLRTRRFVRSYIESKEDPEFLMLHEFAPQNGLEVEEIRELISIPIYKEVKQACRLYNLFYTFGAAPRALSPLSDTSVSAFVSNDSQTRTFPCTSGGALESFITTSDGVVIPYRLEGSQDPNAPLIVLSNCILVDWGIWDSFIDSFFSVSVNKKYRILRYVARGRTSDCGSRPITLDILAADVIALLNALRVCQAAALIGVSLGGATVLNTALKYPLRVAAFMSCDTSAKNLPGSSEAWGERIKIAHAEGAVSSSGRTIVGDKLAEMTVRRWFVSSTYDGGKMEAEANRIKDIVANNSLDGFKKSAHALFNYDMMEEMQSAKAKATFLGGSGDSAVLPFLEQMSKIYGSGAEYIVIPDAGHLPMVEKPKEFAVAVTKFLG